MVSIGIRGAGAAGLHLAVALKERLPETRVAIFDTRPRLPHPERTFCFFRFRDSICPVKPTYTWPTVTFSSPLFRRNIRCDMSPYSLIEGERFFAHQLKAAEDLGVECHWECTEVSIEPQEIRTGEKTHRFDFAVDAAHDARTARSVLWQSFAGVWVESPAPIFDTTSATLMDLDVSACDAPVRFMYMLPTSPTTALIEHTIFHTTSMPKEWHLEACDSWITQQGLGPLNILTTEYGVIPMGLQHATSPRGLLRVGTAAGSLRASTGYGFQTIMRDTELLAEQIADAVNNGSKNIASSPPGIPWWMRYSDRLFVQALAREGASGQALMDSLLHTAPEREIIRFLAGKATFFEAVRVMQCVPKYPMLKSLLYDFTSSLR